MDKNQENQRKSKTLHKPPLVLGVFRLIFKYLGAVFPSIIGRWSYHLWFKTHRSPRPKRELDWLRLTNPRIEAVEVNCESIEIKPLPVVTYYWEKNKTDPLVMLVHGWTGRGSQMAALAEPLLNAGFRVLAFDNHAHGLTPGKATSIFKQSEVQRALAEKFGSADAQIYGIIAHSFGGMVTSYSLAQGMKAQKVICISPAVRFDFLLERFSKTLHLPKSIQRYMVNRFKKEYGDDLVERVSATTTSQQLGHIPALIIHDENDEDVPISEGEILHQSWPNSMLKKTNRLGHRSILYNPQVIEMVVNFLK